jgi:hypothetical protein
MENFRADQKQERTKKADFPASYQIILVVINIFVNTFAKKASGLLSFLVTAR